MKATVSLLGRGNDGAGATEGINGNAVNLKVSRSLGSCCGNTEELKTEQKCLVLMLHLRLLEPHLLCTDAPSQISEKSPLLSSVVKLGTLDIHWSICKCLRNRSNFKVGNSYSERNVITKRRMLCGST